MTIDAPSNPAEQLVGFTTETGWRVVERLVADPNDTGGNFSVPYLCEHLDADGRSAKQFAFMKAMDFSRAEAMAKPFLDAMKYLADAFVWERDLVISCASRRLRNVVVGLEAGEIDTKLDSPLRIVSYIIFEEADGTVRRELDTARQFEVSWLLRVMHQISNGVRQGGLHRWLQRAGHDGRCEYVATDRWSGYQDARSAAVA